MVGLSEQPLFEVLHFILILLFLIFFAFMTLKRSKFIILTFNLLGSSRGCPLCNGTHVLAGSLYIFLAGVCIGFKGQVSELHAFEKWGLSPYMGERSIH